MKKPSIRPRGYTTVTASLAVADVSLMLIFLRAAFDAEPQAQNNEDTPVFASVKLGNAMVFVTNGWAANGHLPQTPASPSAIALHLYVEDIAATVAKAVSAGATLISEPQDTFWGERTAVIADPFGHCWTIAERIEVLSKDEIAARGTAALQGVTAKSATLSAETAEKVDAKEIS